MNNITEWPLEVAVVVLSLALVVTLWWRFSGYPLSGQRESFGQVASSSRGKNTLRSSKSDREWRRTVALATVAVFLLGLLLVELVVRYS